MGKEVRLSPSVDDLHAQYPDLAADPHFKITSEATDSYNCVAWVQRDKEHWIDPEIFWPGDVPEPPEDEPDLLYYVDLFRSWGFAETENADLEEGFLKIAIFASNGEFDHVAKQLPSGRWSSKGGPLFDFRHGSPKCVETCVVMPFTELALFMRRAIDREDAFQEEENGLIIVE